MGFLRGNSLNQAASASAKTVKSLVKVIDEVCLSRAALSSPSNATIPFSEMKLLSINALNGDNIGLNQSLERIPRKTP